MALSTDGAHWGKGLARLALAEARTDQTCVAYIVEAWKDLEGMNDDTLRRTLGLSPLDWHRFLLSAWPDTQERILYLAALYHIDATALQNAINYAHLVAARMRGTEAVPVVVWFEPIHDDDLPLV